MCSLISVGCCVATTTASESVSAQTRGGRGYAYVCDGPATVQEVEEDPGYQVVIVDSVERPNSANGMFDVFQASRPEQCAAMAAALTGAVPGTLLVAVTWAAPHLSIVRSPTTSPPEQHRSGLPALEPADLGAPAVELVSLESWCIRAAEVIRHVPTEPERPSAQEHCAVDYGWGSSE